MADIYSFTSETKPFDIHDLNKVMYDLMENLTNPINQYTIYVPTKGRAGISNTVTTLNKDNINYVLVVEPQEYDLYSKVYPEQRILRLDANDKGLWYSRNYIKEYSRSIGEKKHWQMDDDLEKFFIRKLNGTTNTPTTPSMCISIVEKCTDMFSNVAISGMDGPAYAFSKKYGVQLNRDVGGCVLVNNAVDAKWEYRAAEDVHYTLTVLEAGYCTLRFFHVTVESSPSMKNPGGCTTVDYSSSDLLKKHYDVFASRWPNKISIKENSPDKPKRWKLVRKFHNHYKQQLKLADE